jgi:Ino eighty subunit 2
MPRNIIHSDVSVDPESESDLLSIAPDAEDEPEVEPEEEEEEAEGEGEGEGDEEDEGDEREEEDDGDEVEEEGEEADEPEEEEEDEEPADDGDGDAVQDVRNGSRFPFKRIIDTSRQSDLDELSSPSVSPPPAQTTPSRSSRLKITLKLPTQIQKPTRARRAVHKDKALDSDIESEDSDADRPRGADGKRPLTTRQAVLASVVGSSHVSLGASPSFAGYGLVSVSDWSFGRRRNVTQEKAAE